MDPVTPPLPATAPAPTVPKRDAEATAREFEAMFMGQMTQLMMESVENGGEFSGGHGEQMFRGVLSEKLGVAIAAGGGIGLAPMVLDQIIMLQGGNDAGN